MVCGWYYSKAPCGSGRGDLENDTANEEETTVNSGMSFTLEREFRSGKEAGRKGLRGSGEKAGEKPGA